MLAIQKTPQRQHEDCKTKYNGIQMDKKLRQQKLGPRTRSRMTHRDVKGGTKTKCHLKENQSTFSETRRRKDLVRNIRNLTV